eukprot:1193909-Prorocentrum_minimum.AAC.8
MQVDTCNTTDVPAEQFCLACVKPLQVALAQATFQYIRDGGEGNGTKIDMAALDDPEVQAACGLAVMEALQDLGRRAEKMNNMPLFRALRLSCQRICSGSVMELLLALRAQQEAHITTAAGTITFASCCARSTNNNSVTPRESSRDAVNV